jgi:hypothetical protein
MQWLKQSTAVTLKIGPAIDEDDGKTAETGLTIAQADVRLSKNGGNMAQKNEATSCTHDEIGVYDCPIDATDTNTLGRLQLFVHESGALPIWHEYMVVPANVWDSFFGADYLHTNVAEISEDAAAANNAESFFDGTGYAGTNNVIPTVTTLTGHTAQTGDSYADLADGGRLDLLIDAIKAVTDTTTAALIADAVWDELLTAATHNVATSAGRRLRDLGAFSVISGTAAAGAAQTITLDADASTTANIYNQNLIVITGGTGAGQARMIVEYTTGRVATVDRTWEVNPAAGSEYQIVAFSGILLADNGVAQAGAASTITLATSALAIANSYIGTNIYIAAGTGAGQTRLITAYTAGRVATVSPAWDTQPDNTSAYKVLPVGRSIVESLPTTTQASIDAIEADTNELQTDWADGGRLDLILDAATAPSAAAVADAVWDELSTGHTDAGKAGQQLWTDVDAILADMSTLGAGAITVTYTLTSSVDSSPIPDAQVWVTSDQAGSNLLASGTTNANGVVTFYLDAGTVYIWSQKSGWDFTNPDTETVS